MFASLFGLVIAVGALAQPGGGTGEGTGDGSGRVRRDGTGEGTGAADVWQEGPRLVEVARDRAVKASERRARALAAAAAAAVEAGPLAPPARATPELEPMRDVGREMRETAEAGRAAAGNVAGLARASCRPDPDPAWQVFQGDTVSGDVATLLDVEEAELTLLERISELIAALTEEQARLDSDLQASASIARVRRARARHFAELLDTDTVQNYEAPWLLAPVAALLDVAADQAQADVRQLELRAAFVGEARPYLERRRTTLELLASQPRPELDVEHIQEEINQGQAQLNRESEETDRVEAEADVTRLRADEERRRADETRDERLTTIADEWGTIAPLLDEIRDLRRIEERRLAAVNQRRTAFLREQGEVGERLARILDSPPEDATREARADRLYDEIFRLRRDEREAVTLARAEMEQRRLRIDLLRANLARRRGDLALVLDDRQLQRDDRLYRSIVGLREAQVDLAQKRVDLEQLRLEIQESLWGLARRQVYFYALSTDDLIDALSDARRERVYEITGLNLMEAQLNASDRLIGLSFMMRDRAERLDDLTGWLGSFEGLSWLGELLLLLVLAFVGFRLLLKYRDRVLARVLERLGAYPFLERRFGIVLEVAEAIREMVAPTIAYVTIRLVFDRIALELPELTLLQDALLKVVVLWALIRLSRALILPSQYRREKGFDVAPFAVDTIDIDTRRARLVLLTIRVWAIYFVASGIVLDMVEFAFGLGFAPHLFEVVVFWGQAVLIYGLLWAWRHDIVERFIKATNLGDSRTERLLTRHRDRIYAVLFLLVLFAFNIGRFVYRLVRDRIMTLRWWRRLESFIFRRRIEMAHASSEQDPVTAQPQNVPRIYLRYFADEADVKDLLVARAATLERIEAAHEAWTADEDLGGTVAVPGEFGIGKTVLLNQLEERLAGDLPLTRHNLDRRIVQPGAVMKLLGWLLDVGEADSEQELVTRIRALPRRIVLVDDCHMLFLRTVEGFAAIDTFLRVVTLTAARIFWVLTFDRYAWEYLNRVYDRRHHFNTIAGLGPMTEDQLREMIEKRNSAGNLRPDFSTLLVTGRGSGPANYEVVKTAAGYFRLLTDYAQGNPNVALHFWLQSLRPKAGGGVEVALFKRPAEDTLKALGDRQLFALTAIAQHEDLTAEEIGQVVEVEPDLCQLDVNFLAQTDLVVVDKLGRASLSTPYLRPILTRLQSANLLYFKNV